MTDSEGSKEQGRSVALFVAAVFLTIALVFGAIAGYWLAFYDEPHDMIAVMGGAAWACVSVVVALGLAARAGPIVGVSRHGRGTSVGAAADPDALRAEAWAVESVEWRGEASVPFDAPGPTLFMLLSGIALGCAGLALWWFGRITLGGVAVTFGIGGFLVYWAWVAWSTGRAKATTPPE
ncbi:hypothetical protein JOD31_001477 [Methylopila capsulata]|uniref:Cytochrome c oxidase polypeptide IV n=1 Tax=Methylopila capsulata TaxID=61654 RepID=A0ABS2T4Z0_9HYPH|nr:hypothetical protein [Methylopila capsulata]MBM7851252.1 hypothetical protein [Methylopila capsulata]